MTAVVETMALHVGAGTYRAALSYAQLVSDRVAAATSPANEMTDNAVYFLTEDYRSGFGVNDFGELIGLFSLEKGRGESLVWQALIRSARNLDCFDGFLPGYYERFGFKEIGRDANWTPGGPDVVFMSLAADAVAA